MNCRARKLKCSGDRPSCSNCPLYGATCEYATSRAKSGPPKGSTRKKKDPSAGGGGKKEHRPVASTSADETTTAPSFDFRPLSAETTIPASNPAFAPPQQLQPQANPVQRNTFAAQPPLEPQFDIWSALYDPAQFGTFFPNNPLVLRPFLPSYLLA
ncbi:hypothetical protein EXIGLDRAFT_775736 [Exidia glandulosa HHB12029]|uniref:Zn(2)-C6 fungal-type domain-containing protein n=1 Tax=Exidia glandulosa HHB12029 TaxID=1314781 RepID=A0A165DS85_EXIGL|nr:hypothetical protein EXIGLDRAFT_775736 [Exidia glandulosa HHB12029]